MKESVAIAKKADTTKDNSPTKNDSNIHRAQHELGRQIAPLRGVIGNIQRDGGTPSVESIAKQLDGVSAAQRAPALLALQQTHGNRYVQRVVAGIQAKLVVGQPGDKYEQEADRVADAVMRMTEPEVQRQVEEEELIETKTIADQITPSVQRQVKNEEEEEMLQTKGRTGQTPEVTPNLESRINALRGGGQPLPRSMRNFFEPRFGRDFGQVRIRTDGRAVETAEALNAQAYTLGQDIVFGPGQYAPGTTSGNRLLAHELTHTIQQNSGIRNGVLIQRTLEEDINTLLERRMPSPNTAENRISIIAALCRMQIQAEEIGRLAERRRILREVFGLAEPTGESARLLERLDDPEDSLHDPFNRLATATRNEMLNILRLSAAISHAAENAPQWSFRDPEVGRGTELNPEFWFVRYFARRGQIRMSANNQGEDSSALVALRNHPLWDGDYDEIRLRVEIVDEASASEAVEDAYNPAYQSHYSIECNIGANLVQLRRMHLYYLAQGGLQHRSQSAANQAFDRDYNNFRVDLEVERNPAAPGEPFTREESSLLDTALERLDWERIPILSGPNFNGLVRPGDWAAIDSTDLVSGLFMYENVIYLGNNLFWGQGIQSPFTAQYYAEHYIINTPTRLRRRTPWPSSVTEILRYMFVVPTGRPRSPEINF